MRTSARTDLSADPEWQRCKPGKERGKLEHLGQFLEEEDLPEARDAVLAAYGPDSEACPARWELWERRRRGNEKRYHFVERTPAGGWWHCETKTRVQAEFLARLQGGARLVLHCGRTGWLRS